MHIEEPQSPVYEYTFVGGENNSFFFTTVNNLVYEIKFKPTFYLFPVEYPFSERTYEFIIALVENPNPTSPPLDPLVYSTISKIFHEFFGKHDYNVAVYVCDSSDSRQIARMRKFDDWFYKSPLNGKYTKTNYALIDSKGVNFPISVILNINNPYVLDIHSEFHKVMKGYSQK
jgi:hypothetical protein